jgi:3-dehydroquinate synthase
MIAEAYISFMKKMIDEPTLLQIEEFLFAVYGSVKINKEDMESIIKLTLQDKKNIGNVVKASLIDGIGSCQYDVSINKQEMLKALNYYCGY